MFDVTCPSGFQGVFRGMKVRDEQLFSDRKLAKSGRVISALLDACWQETKDQGPYVIPAGTRPDWDSMLLADRTYLIVQLRIGSYGAKYDFRVTCGGCVNHFVWGVNLNELDVKPVSDAGRRHVRTGEALLVDLPDGRKIKIRLLTGKDEEFITKVAAKDEAKTMTYHLARRIISIDGKERWEDIVKVVEDMDAGVADHVWNVTDELEGGVDTSFDIECAQCHRLQQVVLPFEAGFFSSRKRFALSPESASG
jgi:hypothetical protein